MKNPTPSTTIPARPRGPVTIYQHLALFDALKELLPKKYKGTRGPKNPSQFFERMATRLIREEGKKHGIKLPADLSDRLNS